MIHSITDFHSHILPNMDDGSASIQESLAMLRLEAKQGIHHVVATPHFYPRYDTPENFLARREAAAQRLREAMEQDPELPRLSIGAEVHYFPGISDSDVLTELTIDGKKSILIEMPSVPWTNAMYRQLEGISEKQGLIPVIAHIDRYISPFRTYGIPERLAQLPVLVQANASFFLHASTRRMALRMLQRDQIHLLGSDCHNLTDRRPNLGDAVSWIQERLGKEWMFRMNENEAYALQNEF